MKVYILTTHIVAFLSVVLNVDLGGDMSNVDLGARGDMLNVDLGWGILGRGSITVRTVSSL